LLLLLRFPSPRKKERKKEEGGRINCGDHGIAESK